MFHEVKSILQGITRRTNPVATTTGNVLPAVFDDVGRQVTYPYQVRDLITTAYVSVANGTVIDLLAGGGTGIFHDLVQIQLSNNSGVAATIVLLDDSTTVATFVVPANSSVNFTYPTPIPQSSANGDWEVDMTDITGTTVSITALFIKNV